MIAEGVRAVGYSRAPQKKVVERFKKAKVVCMPTVGAVRHAKKALSLGADILIAQGGEGGGHTGFVPTSLLISEVARLGVPVAAAGGFRDGRGLVAALALGAQGVGYGHALFAYRRKSCSQACPGAVFASRTWRHSCGAALRRIATSYDSQPFCKKLRKKEFFGIVGDGCKTWGLRYAN